MTSDATNLDVGHRLAGARLQRKLSQATVARRAGIAPSYLSRIENGKVHPTFDTLVRVVHGLRASLDEIFSPDPLAQHRRGACPVSHEGRCLVELIRPERGNGAPPAAEQYSARDVRLLRALAHWLRSAGPERIRAMELLLDDLTRALPESGSGSTGKT